MTRRGGALNPLFPLAATIVNGRTKDGFFYPVAMDACCEGEAATRGFACRLVPALGGKFVISECERGRLSVVPANEADDSSLQTVADSHPAHQPRSRLLSDARFGLASHARAVITVVCAIVAAAVDTA